MIKLKVDKYDIPLDSNTRYRLEFKLPMPGTDFEYTSTAFFDLPDVDDVRRALKTSPVLSDSGRFRTYNCTLTIAGMDLRGVLIVTTFGASMRACISFRSFVTDVEKSFSSLSGGRYICCTTKPEYWPFPSYGYLPSIYNPGVYGGSEGDGGANKGFGGVVNWYNSNSKRYYDNVMPITDEENEEGYNTYTRSVFPLFVPYFKKALGGDLVNVDGTFFENSDINSLIMYSHAVADNVVNLIPSEYKSDDVNVYKIDDGAKIAFNNFGENVGFGYVGSEIRLSYKACFLRLEMKFNTPDGEFEFYNIYKDSQSNLIPDDQPNVTHNEDGTTSLSWFGFLEMRPGLLIPSRSLALKQVSGTIFTKGSVTIKYYSEYMLNKQVTPPYDYYLFYKEDVLPSCSIADVISNTSTLFCCTPLVHPATNEVQLLFMSDILRGKTLDISKYTGKSVEIEPQPTSKYKFTFDYPSDGYCGAESFKDMSKRRILESNSYFNAPSPVAGAFLKDLATLSIYHAEKEEDGEDFKWKYYTDSGGEAYYGEEGEEVEISTSCTPLVNQIVSNPDGSKIMIPACKMEGISPVYAVNNKEIPLRLLHWCGFAADSAGRPYPFATSGQRDMHGKVVKSFELMWGGKNGMIATFWKPWLDFIKKSEEVTLTLQPDDADIPKLISLFTPQKGQVENHERFIQSHNVKMLPKSMVIEFTSQSITGIQIKAIRSLIAGKILSYEESKPWVN